VRIRSTLCEQRNWDRLIAELPIGFLLDVVSGAKVFVYDATTRQGDSLAISEGLPVIRGYLETLHGDSHTCGPPNVEYARRFWGKESIELIGRCRKTRHENQLTWWQEIMRGDVSAGMITGEEIPGVGG